MSKRTLVLVCSIFLIVPLLFMGCGSGSDGANGTNGTNGTNAPTTGNISGHVQDTIATAIPSVTVTATNGGGTAYTATTDASGDYTISSLPLGTYTLSFAKSGYTPPGALTLGPVAGATITVNATMSPSGGLSVAITGYNSGIGYSAPSGASDDFGYGGTASVAASATDSHGYAVTYAWSNATSPSIGGTVTGSTTTGTVTFPTIDNAMAFRRDTANSGDVAGYSFKDSAKGRYGVLPILPDTRGALSVKVTVTNAAGQTASATLSLNAASIQTGSRTVARGTRVYLNRGNDNASQTWTLLTRPTGSSAVLSDNTSRTPSFVADVTGAYTVQALTQPVLTIYAGTWRGVIDQAGATSTGYTYGSEAGCLTCHNDTIADNMFDAWYATAHAKIFTLGITGGSGTSGASCLTCHTVGFDRGVTNGGFDDLALTAPTWTFPSSRTSTSWTSMVATNPAVAKLANIQCENCHGPQDSGQAPTGAHMSTSNGVLSDPTAINTFASARITYSSEFCASCHASGTGHNLYSQWSASGHANTSLAISRGLPAADNSPVSCARCHSAQGFTIYVDQLRDGNVGYINNAQVATPTPGFNSASVTATNVQPQTCTACHDPHNEVSNPNQLRLFDNIALLPSGFGVNTFGKGAICTACHNTRNGIKMDSAGVVTDNLSAFLHEDGVDIAANNPFAITGHDHTQADIFTGRNAFFMGGSLPMISKHAAVEDTCVGCHMALNPTTHLSHGTPAVDGHRFGIDTSSLANGMATYCGNCHGAGTVNGEAIQASTTAGLAAVKTSMETALTSLLQSGVDNIVIVGQNYYDNGTRVGSSTSSVTVNTAGANITSVVYKSGTTFEYTITGQTYKVRATLFKASATANPAMSVKWSNGTGSFNANSNLYKACWNTVLITNDFTLGIHNPTFVQQVLNNTKWNLDQIGAVGP